MKKNKEDELQFVVDHYKTGHKNVDNAWKEFNLNNSYRPKTVSLLYKR